MELQTDVGKVMVHACIAHVMKSMKNDLKKIRLKHKASQNSEFSSIVFFQQEIDEPHFHCFSLLVNSWSLDVFTKILTLCNILFSSKYLDQAVTEAEVKLLTKSDKGSIFLRASIKYAEKPRS